VSTAAPRSEPRDPTFTLLLLLLLALFATLLVRSAWLCDDAYITFRVVDNFWNGYGLRWNVIDRVQAYTHPLWLMLATVYYGVTRDAYYTTLLVQGVLSLAAAWLLCFRIALTPAHALLSLWGLILSKAFVDYSTGGLENPLSHLLLALFVAEYLPRAHPSLTRLALLAGLLGLDRLDHLVLVLPALAAAALGSPPRRALRALAIGFAPLMAWTAFAWLYYGFPFPNTAYAKLNTGVPASELMAQGAYYLFNSLSIDPLTPVILLLALGLPLGLRQARALPLSLGLLLYLAYVVRIGGDFMAGRFLAAPFLLAACVLARAPLPLPPLPLGVAFVTMGAVALSSPAPTLTTSAYFFSDRWERRTLIDERGITDERAIYYRYTGLLTARRGEPMPNHHRAAQGRSLRARGESFFRHGQLGMLGFYAGPGVHILDENALTDAFLARLPTVPGWRIGHFYRAIPPGYEVSLRKGVNRLADDELRQLYRRLVVLTRGPLLSSERLQALWDLNFGPGRTLGRAYFAANSRAKRVELLQVGDVKEDGHDWTEGTHRFGPFGIEVALGAVRHPLALELSLDGNDTHKLQCLKLGTMLGEVQVPPRIVTEGGGLTLRQVAFDKALAGWGCDTLKVLPVGGDGAYSLGHVRIVEELAPGRVPEPEELAPAQPLPSEPPGEAEEGKQDDRLPGRR
jgi:arabinofuranosyltransferase